MKKKIFVGVSVILLLTLLLFTSPAQAADYAGHDFSEDSFAVEIDLVGKGDFLSPQPGDPDVIYDFATGVKGTDSNLDDDIQFFMAYMNDSGIEVAYSALEKVETKITLGDLLDPDLVSIIKAYAAISDPAYATALDTVIFEINATSPFQQLVQHFNTPWGSDAFVVNNYMSLIAYSSNETDRKMDQNDKLFLGYTFSVQQLTTKINQILNGEPSTSYQIDPFDYEASFEKTATGYNFGINYTNMFVVWQEIDVEIVSEEGVDVIGKEHKRKPERGIVYGQNIVAASVFDHIAFEYNFEVNEYNLPLTTPIKVLLGNVTTQYHIGETNLLVTSDDQTFIDDHADNWTDVETPFVYDLDYTVTVPEGLRGIDLDAYPILNLPDLPPFPDDLTIPLPDMAFYTGDAAKIRMMIEDSFGLTIATATNCFDVKIIERPYTTHHVDPKDPIGVETDGHTFFWTSFQNKDTYTLTELDFMASPPPTDGHKVIVTLFNPAGWSVESNLMKAYFIVEFALAFTFTKFVATKIAPEITYPGTKTVLLGRILYFTFTEFPEWYGGEIFHDPAYSAVAAMAAVGEESSTETGTTGTETGTDGGIPGFEILSVLLAIPPLYALYRKRRH